jgi:hypothetical protein
VNRTIHFLALILLFSSVKVFSQTNAILAWDAYGMEEHYDTLKSYIGINGNLLFGSTCITAGFANNFISNSFIDTTMTKQVSSRFSSINRMGYDLDEGITYVHQKDTIFHIPVSGYFIALRDRNHTDAVFPGDLFNIIFQGNAMYAAKIAHLDGLNLNAMHYQQLEFGLAKVFPIYKASYSIGFALSLLKGQSDLAITTGNTTLGTPATGDSLDITLAANIRQTDTTNSGGYGAFNGWGLSTDFYIKFYDSTSEMSVRLDVKDLGFIRWNSRSVSNNLDTTFTFSGINVANLLTPGDSLTSLSLDSNYTKAYHAHQERQAYTTKLPAYINLSFRMFLDEENKMPLDAAINFRLFANYTPFVYGGISYFITNKTIIGGSVSYGGYRKLGFGINIGGDLGKGYLIALQTQNIESIVLPNNVTGEAALLSFKKFF